MRKRPSPDHDAQPSDSDPATAAVSGAITGPLSRRRFLVGAMSLGVAACAGSDTQSNSSGSTVAPASTSTPSNLTSSSGPFGSTTSTRPTRRSPNRYLSGNFAPVQTEVSRRRLDVVGAIPPELSGHLLRQGPNPIGPVKPTDYHWFLGDGMTHAVELRDGAAVSYRNRWVRTDGASEQLDQPPIPNQVPDISGIGNLANTSLVAHAGRVLALFEVSLPTEITTDLRTVGRYNFGGALKSPMTAHPKIDPRTGEMWFFGLDPINKPHLHLHVVDAQGALIRTEPVSLPGPTMMHDFALTTMHVVFLDQPVVYDFALLGQRPFPAKWTPSYGARIGLMPRNGTGDQTQWFDMDLGYVFHVLNAFETTTGNVVIDVARYETMFDRDVYGVDDALPRLERWTVDRSARKVTRDQLDDRPQEFGTIDRRRLGEEHRYAYFARVPADAGGFALAGLVKHDLRRGTATEAILPSGSQAGEPMFVPASPDSGEDEGWVLSYVYDATSDGSSLMIFDATDFTAPVATISLPQRVPFGFHSAWVPAS